MALVAGLLLLAFDKTKGTTTVWTSLVTVAGGLGVSGASLRAGAKRASGTFEQSIKRSRDQLSRMPKRGT